jgi:anaerobic selenocysteine-containing dehydrogenase
MTAQVSIKLNRGHLVTGRVGLILPCLGRTEVDRQSAGEQFVTTENSMGVVELSRGVLEPAGRELLSEPAIVCRLARAVLGEKSKVAWEELAGDYDRIRELIARVIPGCEGYNEKVRRPGGFYLPNGAREGTYKTETGKARFTVHAVPRTVLAADEFLMTTIRSHDQFNTTIYGMGDVYRGVQGHRHVIYMNRQDMRDRGLVAGVKVDLVSNYGGVERVARGYAVVPYEIPRRCTATYFPETNVLVPIGETAEKSGTPISKSVVIRIRKGTTNTDK